MTEALIKCGAPPEIKCCVHQLWAAYLSKMEVAYMKDNQPVERASSQNHTLNDEPASIIPDWFSQASTGGKIDTDMDEGATTDDSSFHFAPAKV